MEKQINQAAVDELEAVATKLSISLVPGYKERIINWDIKELKKIWAVGEKSGRKVLLKIRPTNSVTPLDEFRVTEQREKVIADHLTSEGVPSQRVTDAQLESSPEWIVREFLDGQPIGSMSYNPDLVNEDKLFDALLKLRSSLNELTKTVGDQVTGRNWFDKWQSEYNSRRHYIAKHLGDDAVKTADQAFGREVDTTYQQVLLHNDLAPQNIIISDGRPVVIDWGEVALGPEAIDWATAWSFAIFQPDLRQKIVEHVLVDGGAGYHPNHRAVFIALAARLLGSLAEYHDYRVTMTSDPIGASLYNKGSLKQAFVNFNQLISK